MLGRFAAGINLAKISHQLFDTERGRLIVSIVFGFAIAIMFQRVCRADSKEHKCILLRAPPLKDISGKVFKTANGDCYTYEPEYMPCKA
jgi:hypothetical protein